MKVIYGIWKELVLNYLQCTWYLITLTFHSSDGFSAVTLLYCCFSLTFLPAHECYGTYKPCVHVKKKKNRHQFSTLIVSNFVFDVQYSMNYEVFVISTVMTNITKKLQIYLVHVYPATSYPETVCINCHNHTTHSLVCVFSLIHFHL